MRTTPNIQMTSEATQSAALSPVWFGLVFSVLAAMVTIESAAVEVPFGTASTIESAFDGAYSVQAGDVDGDGDLDLFGAAEEDDDAVWWENTNGDGSSWTRHDLNTSFDQARMVVGADLDGDGDFDLAGVASTADDLVWWENTLGDGSSWTEHTIEGNFDGATWLMPIDIDQDGAIDLVAAAKDEDKVAWFENRGDGSAWTERTIDASFVEAETFAVADLDGDGDPDVIGAGSNVATSTFSWWDNTAGDGSAWTETVLESTSSRSVHSGDVDGDGDQDLVRVEATEISWWENTAGNGSTWTEHSVDATLSSGRLATVIDLDQDGDLDLVAADSTLDTIAWWENAHASGDGSVWTVHIVDSVFDGARAVAVADVDSDGDPDVLGAALDGDQIAWWENHTLHRSAVFFEHQVSNSFDGAASVAAGDLDGDGDLDIVGAAEDAGDIVWWENDGSACAPDCTWSQHTIDSFFTGASFVSAVDIDSDGKIDVLGAAESGRISWWRNDGSWTETQLSTLFVDITSLSVADIDGNGTLDVVAPAPASNSVWWFQNSSGDGSSWNQELLAGYLRPTDAIATDVDGDGDVDVVAASQAETSVVWWENTTGTGSSWTEHTVDASFNGHSVAAADLDGDGDTDVQAGGSDAAWWENTAGDGSTWTRHTTSTNFPLEVSSADVDRDGDLDFLAAMFGGNFQWWENDGSPCGGTCTWTEHTVAIGNMTSFSTADVDGDGNLDLLSAASSGDEIAWLENQGGQFALPTIDSVVSALVNQGTDDVLLLEIQGAHRGRAGDGDLELVTFELLFEEALGDPLTGSELGAMADSVRLYHDDGDGVFETDGSDSNFHTVESPFSLAGGVLTLTFVDGEADVQVAFGTDEIYFVAVDFNAAGGTALPHTLLISHLTESSSTGEMTSTDLPLVLEGLTNVSSSEITVNGPPTVAASIANQIIYVDSPFSSLIGDFFDLQEHVLSLTATGLPASISLTTDGILSGKPTAADAVASPFNIVVRATDPGGLFVEDSFDLYVISPPDSQVPIDAAAQNVAPLLDGADDLVFGDIDNDGDLDLVTSATQTSDVTLWKNTSGDGSSWSVTTIKGAFPGSDSVAVGDVDRDGDLDVLASARTGDTVAWFENTAGDGSFWSRIDVDDSFSGPVDAELCDLDGDGDSDVVAAGADADQVAWWRNNGNGGGWSKTTVQTSFDASSVDCADFDRDGDLDILATSFADDLVAWWENTSGDGSSWTQQSVTTAFTGPADAIARDVDSDGDIDVFFAADTAGSIGWSENLTGDGLAWLDHLISDAPTSPVAIRAFDLDADGDLDAVSADASGKTASWWENIDSKGVSWVERPVVASSGSTAGVAIGDIDGDGDADFAASDSNGDVVEWWENETLHRSALFATEHIVDADLSGTLATFSADIDGDGDLDVLGAGFTAGKIVWWENPAEAGSAWTEHTIDAAFPGAASVSAADLDGDGDLDVMGGTAGSTDIFWWENTAGDGTAWNGTKIQGGFDAWSVSGADIDGDGDLDVLGAAFDDDEIAWFENTAGDANAWTGHTVDATFGGAISVHPADIDGDGDLDILGAAADDNEIAWWENTAGNGTSWTEHTVDAAFGGAEAVFAADIDGDGDLDLLGAAFDDNDIAWWENTGGDGTSWTEHTVDGDVSGAASVFAADFDADGDVDILGTGDTAFEVVWWENTAGDGSSWGRHVITASFDNAASSHAVDIDQDGDLDVVATSFGQSRVTWWENQGGHFALPTTNAVASATPNEGSADVLVLEIEGAHRGRTGDGDLELVTFELLFEEAPADPLTGSELDAIVDALRIYRDDGDGSFETDGSDVEFRTAEPPFDLFAGVLTANFVDGATDVQVSFGTTETFFVALDLASGAGSASPNTLTVTHLTESSSSGEMTSTDIPLDLEYFADTSSTPMTVQQTNPEISFNSLSLDFASQDVGAGPTASQSVTITNNGSATLNITSVTLEGTDPAEFGITSDTGEATLAPTASRTVMVAFDPNSIGTKSAVLRVESDDADESTVDVSLAGIGTDREITVDPVLLNFGSQELSAGATASQSVTITNDGAATLNITSVTLDGTDPAEFSITSDTGETTLAPTASRTVMVEFDPSSTGAKAAVLRVQSDDADEPTVDVTLDGTGTESEITVDPLSLDFGSQPLGAGGTASQSVTITNDGSAALNITSVTLDGTDPAEFSIASDTGETTLAPAASRTVMVDFDPNSTGAKVAVLRVQSDDADEPTVEVSLAGIGTDPEITVDPLSLDFGSQPLSAGATASQSVTITNDGSATLNITGVTLDGTDPAEFSIASDTGETALAPAASRTVMVEFDPSSTGAKAAVLRVVSDDGDESTIDVALAGTGTSPDISVSPLALAFGDQPTTGGATASQDVTIENSGTATLAISAVSLVGGDAAEFQIVSDTGETALAPGQTRTVSVVFDPTTAGEKSSDLNILWDLGSVEVSLTGTGLAPEIAVSPESIVFSVQVITFGPSAAQTVTISNNGSADLNISEVSFVGSNAADFMIADDSGENVLAPTASRTVEIQFEPSGVGLREAALRVTSDDADDPQVEIGLSGEGVTEAMVILIDGFESGDTSAWSATVP